MISHASSLASIWHCCKAMKVRWTVGDQAGMGGGNRAQVRTTCLRGPVVGNRREIGFSKKAESGLAGSATFGLRLFRYGLRT